MIRTAARRAFAVVACLAVAACGPRISTNSAATPASQTATPPTPVVIAASVPAGATIAAGERVTVTAAGGPLRTIWLTDAAGTRRGAATDVESWQTPKNLPPLRTYTITATSADSAGAVSEWTHTFSTAAPATELKTDIYPYGDRVVGIAHPIVVHLSAPVKGKARARVEAGLTVDVDKAFKKGAWAWLSDTELHYRPADFWPAHARVTIGVELDGVNAGNGAWGVLDREVSFRTGRAMVLRVDDATHQMTVDVDGKRVRTVKVSLGKPGFETRSGIKMISEKHEKYRMRSETIGVTSGPDEYDVTVPFALRITNSGEFIHGAPWNKSIGKANKSHGCTNVGLADARWLYDNTLVGDPVFTKGPAKQMEGWNGLGAEWNYEFGFWKTLSAL